MGARLNRILLTRALLQCFTMVLLANLMSYQNELHTIKNSSLAIRLKHKADTMNDKSYEGESFASFLVFSTNRESFLY